MRTGLRYYLLGSIALVTLVGCGRGVMQFGGEREPWREQAEAACMKSGAVKEGPSLVRIEPIEGPGMCGAAYPLKVAALGEGPLLGYGDELRPPGSIPNGG
ncbi:MAG: extensin, partial [Pseudolabrys sp.]|nr:extensin [Pseudolabrys sp.]